jgi:hypothetical protein
MRAWRNASLSVDWMRNSQSVFLKRFSKARRSGRQHKALGGAEGETLGQVWGAIKPMKRAACSGLSPTAWALGHILPLSPWVHAPSFMLHALVITHIFTLNGYSHSQPAEQAAE